MSLIKPIISFKIASLTLPLFNFVSSLFLYLLTLTELKILQYSLPLLHHYNYLHYIWRCHTYECSKGCFLLQQKLLLTASTIPREKRKLGNKTEDQKMVHFVSSAEDIKAVWSLCAVIFLS